MYKKLCLESRTSALIESLKLLNKNKKQLWIVGVPNGNTTLSMCEYAGTLGYECCPVLPEDLEACFHELRKHQSSVPIAVESAYSPEQLAHISRAVLVGGVCIVPVGEQSVWEAIIPLEMPELYALPVLPVYGEWYDGAGGTAPVTQAADDSPFCEVNGTVVFCRTPKLMEPVADLNRLCSVPESVTVAPKRKKKADATLYLLLALLGVAFLSVLGALCALLLPNDEVEHAALQEMQNSVGKVDVEKEENAQAKVREETVTPVAPDKETPVEPEVSPLVEHQEQVCSLINWEKARPGNDEYKQLQAGADMGCSVCMERLKSPLVQHVCPSETEDVSEYRRLLMDGKNVGCDECAAKIRQLSAGASSGSKKKVSGTSHKRGKSRNKKRKPTSEKVQPEKPTPVAPPEPPREPEPPSWNHIEVYGA